jgi:hypothetical protein
MRHTHTQFSNIDTKLKKKKMRKGNNDDNENICICLIIQRLPCQQRNTKKEENNVREQRVGNLFKKYSLNMNIYITNY